MMLADEQVTPERLVLWNKQDTFKTEVSRSCFIVGNSREDTASLRIDAKSPPDASIHISKDLTQSRTRLSFVLPSRLMSKGDEIRLQYRYIPARGQLAGVTSLAVADENGKCTPLMEAAPTHTSTWQGQVTVSAHYRVFTDLVAVGHDRLVWAMELETDPISCDLIDVSISSGDCWVVVTGTDLLHREAVRDESAIPAGDDLAGLIRLFEAQYDAWGQRQRALADEIDYLRRSLDEARLRPCPGSNEAGRRRSE